MKTNGPWWYSYRKQKYRPRNHLNIEMIIRKSCVETFMEYLGACSVGGIKQIMERRLSKFHRFFWIAVFCAALTIVCMYLHTTWLTTFTRPLIVTSESVTYPIQDMDFPAVALCNVNRISYKALVTFVAKMMPELEHTNKTMYYLQNYFKNLGRLLDYRYDEDLQRIINSFHITHFNVDIIEMMQELAPSCEEMLVKCHWAGEEVNCTNIFYTRRTGLGHCCTFNYILERNSADSPHPTGFIEPIKRQVVQGANNGLMVVADPMEDDYAYRLGIRNGFDVLIFDPKEFPDLSSGRVLYRMAQIEMAEFLRIQSIKQYATNEVHKYPFSSRKCRFRHEMKHKYNNMYSYSACLVKCRIETVRSLCKCIPYFYPTRKYKNEKVCTLRHLRCLNKYKEKLLYYFPKDAENTTGLEAELVDSLFCEDCEPDCELTQHFTQNFKVPISKITRTGYGNNFLVGVNLTNKCVVHVYRPGKVGVLHRLDVVAYWFEILSNIGGFAGMVMGIGCFTFVEIFYFLVIRLVRKIYSNYKKYY